MGSITSKPAMSEKVEGQKAYDLAFDFYRDDGLHVGTGLFDDDYADLHHCTINMRAETFAIVQRLIGDGLHEGRVNGIRWSIRP